MPALLDYAVPPATPSDRRGVPYVLALSANLCGLTFAAYMAVVGGTERWAWAWLPAWLAATVGGVLQVGLTTWAAAVAVELRRPAWYDPLIWVAWLATAGYLIALPVTLVACR
jgi:hypothetical protein